MMVKRSPTNELTTLYNALMPALSRAAVGDFDGEVEIDPAHSRQVNEILMGVEVLLEVIREKDQELLAASGGTTPRKAQRDIGLLDEVLKKSADR